MLENTSDPFGALLKQFRKRRRITQQQLAEALSVHRNTIGRWEEGSFLPESKTLVVELARHLHLTEQEARQLLDASLSAPAPLWSVPYPRNPFFTGREEMLATLHARLGPGQQVALTQSYALHGLGGIGKTQLALEYAYRFALEYRAIFWIGAETVEQVHTSLLRIAERLDLPERMETEQQRIVAAVQRWLEMHGAWLLIWDNLEELDLIQRYLPTNRSGAVLITTRRHAPGTIARGIDLAPMEEEEGMLFLLRRANVLEVGATGEQVHHLAMTMPTEYTAASELVKVLGRLPLALDQAGAYIEETQCGLTDFLTLFQQYPLQVLQERGTHAEHPASVVKTFVLSFERLRQNHPAAAELLTACCFLAPEEIPESLFTHHALQLFPALQEILASPLAFHSILKSLLAYALVQRHPARQTLAVHRLVQAVLKAQLSDEQQHEWLARLVNLLAHAFPQDVKAVETWPWCEQLLPHALHCLEQIEGSERYSPELCLLLTRTATYLFRRAQLSAAEPLFQRALALQTRRYGAIHAELAPLLISLADLKRKQGQYEEAEASFQRALSILEHTPDPLQQADALNGLGILYLAQGLYQKVEPLYLQSLSLREHLLGPHHTEVASSLNNLALLYTRQSRYEEAERLLLRVISIREQALGVEHASLAIPLNNLAILSIHQSRDNEGQRYLQLAISILEKSQGPDHPDLATMLNNLAETYDRQQRLEEAEETYRRAYFILEQNLGAEHPDLAYSLQGLAHVYGSMGKYQEAEDLFLRALRIWQQISREHPESGTPLYGLADLLFNRGRYTEAQDYCQRALVLWRQTFGSAHVEIANALHLSGKLWLAQKQYAQAEQVFHEALAMRLTLLGAQHLDVADSAFHLAEMYRDQRKYEQAEPLYQQALHIRKQVLEPEHHLLADAQNGLANSCLSQITPEQA